MGQFCPVCILMSIHSRDLRLHQYHHGIKIIMMKSEAEAGGCLNIITRLQRITQEFTLHTKGNFYRICFQTNQLFFLSLQSNLFQLGPLGLICEEQPHLLAFHSSDLAMNSEFSFFHLYLPAGITSP